MTQEEKSAFWWSALALLFGIIMIIPMMLREFFRFKRRYAIEWYYEWENIEAFTILICVFSFFHFLILHTLFDAPLWLLI